MNLAEIKAQATPATTTTTRIEPSIIIVTVVIFVVVLSVIVAGLFSLRRENIQKQKATSHHRNNSVSTISTLDSLDLEKNPDWVLEHQRRHIIQKSLASRSASPTFDLRPPTRALTRTSSNGTLRSDWKELEAGMHAGLSSSHPAIHAEQ